MMSGKLGTLYVVAACLSVSAAYPLNDSSSCPNMVSRAEWGARPSRGVIPPLAVSPAPFVVIHHGGTNTYCTTEESCSRIVRTYQNHHLDANGWADIGYSFVVGEDGNVYVGRGWNNMGAHAPPFNNQSIGICVIGDFTDRLPNEAALQAVSQLIQCGVEQGAIKEDYGLLGHRQARATACPGDTFYRKVVTMPHWVPHPVPVKAKLVSNMPSPSINGV